MPKTIINGSDENRVTVYVWQGSPGHTSLQTYSGGRFGDGIYASWWPAEGNKKDKCSYKGVKSHNPKNLAEDVRLEDKKPPDLTIHLYSLDVNTINKEYLLFHQMNCNWSAWGSSFFADKNTNNCSGLVSFLLHKGGIKNLVLSTTQSTTRATTTIGSVVGTGVGGVIVNNAFNHAALVQTLPAASEAARGVLSYVGYRSINYMPQVILNNVLFSGTGPVIAAGVIIATVAALISRAAGATAGGTVDLAYGTSHIVRPDGVGAIINAAREVELKRFDIKNDDNLNESSSKKEDKQKTVKFFKK